MGAVKGGPGGLVREGFGKILKPSPQGAKNPLTESFENKKRTPSRGKTNLAGRKKPGRFSSGEGGNTFGIHAVKCLRKGLGGKSERLAR